jgi:hypothetical protein
MEQEQNLQQTPASTPSNDRQARQQSVSTPERQTDAAFDRAKEAAGNFSSSTRHVQNTKWEPGKPLAGN